MKAFKTRCGWVSVHTTSKGVSKIVLGSKKTSSGDSPLIDPLCADIVDYFNGVKVDFGKYSLDLDGCTGFQRRVLGVVREIPYGRTLTYGQVASRVGNPGAAQAIGNALKKNPIPILIPCHRVTASDGLGGFSGGAELKRHLLKLEGVL